LEALLNTEIFNVRQRKNRNVWRMLGLSAEKVSPFHVIQHKCRSQIFFQTPATSAPGFNAIRDDFAGL
jgi:hypothetical protein